VSGVAKKHDPAATPVRQARQLDESPEAHVTFYAAHQIEDAAIPAVFREDAHSLAWSSRYAIRGLRPGREAVRLVHGKQIDQFSPVEPIADDVCTGPAPALE